MLPARSRRLPMLWLLTMVIPALEAAEPRSPTALPSPAAEKEGFIFSLIPNAFAKKPVVDMTFITEMTAEGRKRPPVLPAAPAYYELYASGYREIGGSYGGVKPPVPAILKDTLTRALAVNGYLAAQRPEKPPGLLLIYHWGAHNRLEPEFAESDPVGAERNVFERALLVGGLKFALELAAARDSDTIAVDALNPRNMDPIMGDMGMSVFSRVHQLELRSRTNERLLTQLSDDVYFVVVSAHDYNSVAGGISKLLWRTKMTVNTQGVSMAETLPPLIVNAADYFGHEMTEAAVGARRIYRDGKVEIGPLKVEDYLAPAPEAGPDGAPAPAPDPVSRSEPAPRAGK